MNIMRSACFGCIAGSLFLFSLEPALADGRYLVLIAGCNDCHTPNWNETGGTVPQADWLTGTTIGFRGPWGTTYPSNLRLLVNELNEDAWVRMLHERKERPPMPWISTNNMTESDVRDIYRFIKSLGSTGTRMPVAVGPDVEPTTPYIVFEPQHLERLRPALTSAPTE